MLKQYFKFFVNGGILGLVSWAIQVAIYKLIGIDSGIAFAVASVFAYLPMVIINFLIQKAWIFKKDGLFKKFVIANLAIMVLVSLLSPLCRTLIAAAFGVAWGDKGGFILAALIGSVPSFLLKRHWVFEVKKSSLATADTTLH